MSRLDNVSNDELAGEVSNRLNVGGGGFWNYITIGLAIYMIFLACCGIYVALCKACEIGMPEMTIEHEKIAIELYDTRYALWEAEEYIEHWGEVIERCERRYEKAKRDAAVEERAIESDISDFIRSNNNGDLYKVAQAGLIEAKALREDFKWELKWLIEDVEPHVKMREEKQKEANWAITAWAQRKLKVWLEREYGDPGNHKISNHLYYKRAKYNESSRHLSTDPKYEKR
jgi:hypothetical protein